MLLDLPATKGTYILWLNLTDTTGIQIGKLGYFEFRPDWYAYVGSAFGAGGLRGRLRHHLTPPAKPHWHIDYLRAAAPVREVWYRSDQCRHEHRWARTLLNIPDASMPAKGFGASDCDCQTHLIQFSTMPDPDAFQRDSTMQGAVQVFHIRA